MGEKVFKSAKTEWRDVVLVCRKCSKKLDGGFGPGGDLTLKKALRKYLHLKTGKKGRKGALTVPTIAQQLSFHYPIQHSSGFSLRSPQ